MAGIWANFKKIGVIYQKKDIFTDNFIARHWIMLSLLAVLFTICTYCVIIQGIKRTIVTHPFHTPEVVDRNTKPIRL